MKCEHELAPLVPRPTDTVGRIDYLFCPVASYLLCRLCGRVGYYTRSRRLAFLRPADAERVCQQAREWKREPPQPA